MDLTSLLQSDKLQDTMKTIENSNLLNDLDTFDLKEILKNDEFKMIVSNISNNFMSNGDDLNNIMNSPGFADEIMDMASNIDIDNIVTTAGGMFGLESGKLSTIKDSMASAKKGLTDMYNTPSDVIVEITISQGEAYLGRRKKMTVKRISYVNSKPFQEKQRLIIHIPPGTRHLKEIKIENEGDEYLSDSELKRCNLIIKVNVKDDPNFKLIGDDFYYTLDVNLMDFTKDMYYNISFVDGDIITLFKPKDFALKGRLVGVIDNLGMTPENTDELVGDIASKTSNKIGRMFVFFNIATQSNNIVSDLPGMNVINQTQTTESPENRPGGGVSDSGDIPISNECPRRKDDEAPEGEDEDEDEDEDEAPEGEDDKPSEHNESLDGPNNNLVMYKIMECESVFMEIYSVSKK